MRKQCLNRSVAKNRTAQQRIRKGHGCITENIWELINN